MVPAIIAFHDRRKYKKYASARTDTFYVLWVLIPVMLIAWLVENVVKAVEGDDPMLEEIGFNLVTILILAILARIDFIFCKVVNYYANVTCRIEQLEAKIEKLARIQDSSPRTEGLKTKSKKQDLSLDS